MSQISDTEKHLLEKMSFSDYVKPSVKAKAKKTTPKTSDRRNQKKTKLTLYLTEEEEILFNEIYIKRLKEGNKTDRSTLFSEAVRLLYKQEVKK